MKTNTPSLIAALLFSLLFYNQGLGFNLLLFAILAIIMVTSFRSSAFKHKETWILAAAYSLCALAVFLTHSVIAIVMTFITFFVFIGSLSGIGNSVYVRFINGMYNAVMGLLHYTIERSSAIKKNPLKTQKNIKGGFIFFTSLLTLLIIVLFSWLYSKANPVFLEWVQKIDLSFINFGWLCTVIMGFVLFKNLTAPVGIDALTAAERALPFHLKQQEHPLKTVQLHKEHFLGCMLIGALNLLILVFLLTDVLYIFKNPLQDAVALSGAVHEGVNALIASIGIAITLLLLLFRGDLNFYTRNTTLKKLAFIWIILNILLVLFTAYKNGLYISGFGFTYKRIGVFAYLFLCISGLITSYLKIKNTNNIHFMLRANATVLFALLIVFSCVNWDKQITRYNLQHIPHPDLEYLLELSYANSSLLYAFAKANPETSSAHPKIKSRYQKYQKKLAKQTWQSSTWDGWAYIKSQSR